MAVEVEISKLKKIPTDWRFVQVKIQNNGEGHGAEPYVLRIYEDKNGKIHELMIDTFNIEAANLK